MGLGQQLESYAKKEIAAKENDPVKRLKREFAEDKQKQDSQRKKRSSKNNGSKY